MNSVSYLRFILIITIVTACNGEGDAEAGKTCSKEGGCPDASFKYDTTIPKDITADLRETLQTIAAVQMYTAQRHAAHYLEFAYLSLADHPEQAVKVRSNALEAKQQHMMSSHLMNMFKVTAAHIVETLIPIIYDAHIILKDEAVVIQALDEIVKVAEEMKKESETTRDKYMKISQSVHGSATDVEMWNKHVTQEQERIRLSIEEEKKLLEADATRVKELKEEKQKQDDMIEILKSDRDMMREQAGMAGQNLHRNSGKTFLDYTVAAGPAFAGNIAGSVVLGAFGFVADMFFADRRMEEFKDMMEAYRQAHRSLEQAYDKKRAILSEHGMQRKIAIERKGRLKKLGIESANFGDVRSLYEALGQLGEVEIQLTRIAQIWSHIVESVGTLKLNTKTGKLFLGKQDDPKYTERFLASMGRTRQGWDIFRNISAAYVKASDKEINNLYSFLAAPIYNMAAEKRAERQRILLQEIQADIDIIYPELD